MANGWHSRMLCLEIGDMKLLNKKANLNWKKRRWEMSMSLPIEIKNHFDVILGTVNDAKNYFHYALEILNSLQTNEDIEKICRDFWSHTHNVYYNSGIICLMLLYDRSRSNGGLINFLEEVKKMQFPNFPLDEVDTFLIEIKKEDFDVSVNTLKTLRDKKFFHIDKKNARGEFKSNLDQSPEPEIEKAIEKKKNDVSRMLDAVVAIVETLCPFFGYNAKEYIVESRDLPFLFDLLSILFSEEKLEKRLKHIRFQKQYRF